MWGCVWGFVRSRSEHPSSRLVSETATSPRNKHQLFQGGDRTCRVPSARASLQQYLPPWRSGAGCCCGSARPSGTGLPPRRGRWGWCLLGSPCPGVPAASVLEPGLRTKGKESELLERWQKCQGPGHFLWREGSKSRAGRSRDALRPREKLLPSLYPGGRGNTCSLLQIPGALPPTQPCSAAPPKEDRDVVQRGELLHTQAHPDLARPRPGSIAKQLPLCSSTRGFCTGERSSA